MTTRHKANLPTATMTLALGMALLACKGSSTPESRLDATVTVTATGGARAEAGMVEEVAKRDAEANDVANDGSGKDGIAVDARDGLGVEAGRYCQGLAPATLINTCRRSTDCGGSPVVCSVGRYDWGPSACPLPPNSQPCPQECLADKDCTAKTGGKCSSFVRSCPNCNGHTCSYPPPPCTTTPDSCATGTRCRTDGTCEPLPCTAGYTCGEGTRCNATAAKTDTHGCEWILCDQGFLCSAKNRCNVGAAKADVHGCEPTPCDQGNACSVGYRCALGSTRADTYGCEPTPCNQGYTCPENTRCSVGAASVDLHGCATMTCSTDNDCDCGFCVSGACSQNLGTCQYAPA